MPAWSKQWAIFSRSLPLNLLQPSSKRAGRDAMPLFIFSRGQIRTEPIYIFIFLFPPPAGDSNQGNRTEGREQLKMPKNSRVAFISLLKLSFPSFSCEGEPVPRFIEKNCKRIPFTDLFVASVASVCVIWVTLCILKHFLYAKVLKFTQCKGIILTSEQNIDALVYHNTGQNRLQLGNSF